MEVERKGTPCCVLVREDGTKRREMKNEGILDVSDCFCLSFRLNSADINILVDVLQQF